MLAQKPSSSYHTQGSQSYQMLQAPCPVGSYSICTFLGQLKVLMINLGRPQRGEAADKDLSAGMLKDLRYNLFPAAAKGLRQLSEASVITS